MFGVYEGARYQKLKQYLKRIADLFRSPFTSRFLFFPFLQKDLGAWSPWGKFLRDRQQLDQVLYAEITERRDQLTADRSDILSLLMSARDEAGNPMTDRALRDELITLLIAGYETTATAVAWALSLIYQHPEVQAKLLLELANLGDRPDSMSLVKLPYLTAVCHEVLRIRTIVPLPFCRVVQTPVELLGHRLEPGTVLFACIFLLHQRQELYPEPKRFKPERFLERQFSPYEFMPFGGGVRRCVGEALALFEMKLVLATLLSRYQFALVDDQPEGIRRRGVTLAPARGVRMVITRKLTC